MLHNKFWSVRKYAIAFYHAFFCCHLLQLLVPAEHSYKITIKMYYSRKLVITKIMIIFTVDQVKSSKSVF